MPLRIACSRSGFSLSASWARWGSALNRTETKKLIALLDRGGLHLLVQRAQHQLVDGDVAWLLEREHDRAGHIVGVEHPAGPVRERGVNGAGLDQRDANASGHLLAQSMPDRLDRELA